MTRHWRIADGVAWVAAEPGRVALVDTRRGAQAEPMHVQMPYAILWTALGSGPATQADLEVVAADHVGEGEVGPFVASFIESLGGIGLLEEGPS